MTHISNTSFEKKNVSVCVAFLTSVLFSTGWTPREFARYPTFELAFPLLIGLLYCNTSPCEVLDYCYYFHKNWRLVPPPWKGTIYQNGLSEKAVLAIWFICDGWLFIESLCWYRQSSSGWPKQAHTHYWFRKRSVKIVNIWSILQSYTQAGMLLGPKVPIFAVLELILLTQSSLCDVVLPIFSGECSTHGHILQFSTFADSNGMIAWCIIAKFRRNASMKHEIRKLRELVLIYLTIDTFKILLGFWHELSKYCWKNGR